MNSKLHHNIKQKNELQNLSLNLENFPKIIEAMESTKYARLPSFNFINFATIAFIMVLLFSFYRNTQ